MTLAATLVTPGVCDGIHADGRGVLMHGPTFMANPLACAVAEASLNLLESSPWVQRVAAIEAQLREELAPAREMSGVADVRVMGAIGVIEMEAPLDMASTQQGLMERGVWLRPFGRLLYAMPPYVIGADQLSCITNAMLEIAHG